MDSRLAFENPQENADFQQNAGGLLVCLIVAVGIWISLSLFLRDLQ
jgi:hypothetical protein